MTDSSLVSWAVLVTGAVLVTCEGWGRTTRSGEIGVSDRLLGRCRPRESGPDVLCRLSAPVERGPSSAVPRRAAVHGARAIRLPWFVAQTAGLCRDSGRCSVSPESVVSGVVGVAVSVGVPVLTGSGLVDGTRTTGAGWSGSRGGVSAGSAADARRGTAGTRAEEARPPPLVRSSQATAPWAGVALRNVTPARLQRI